MLVNGTAAYKRYGYRFKRPIVIDSDYVWWVDGDLTKFMKPDTIDIWNKEGGLFDSTEGRRL